MMWVTIILAVLQALPALIELIQQIFGKMEGKPIRARLKIEHELQSHLLEWHRDKDDAALRKSLRMMGRSLGCPAAAPVAGEASDGDECDSDESK